MTTMQDVAAHAGVSVMTVSNVVNGHPRVRASTRERVLASIDELGYHVNTTARSLRQGRTGVVGLAIPEIDRPYFGLLASLLIDRAAERGFELVVEQTAASRDREIDAISRSRLRSYDGLILHSSALHDHDAQLLRGAFPIVVLGERAYSGDIDHVVMANAHGAELATAHLIERGCRRIAMIGGRLADADDIDVASTRTAGYRAALENAGLTLDPALVREAPYTFEHGRAAAAAAVDELGDVDGFVCATDLVAVGVVRGLHDRGLEVPRDALVVGFDDVPLTAFTVPSLTTIAPDHEAMAAAAIALLADRITGIRAPGDYRTVTGDVRLVVRESTSW